MTQEELDKIVEQHQHWLKKDCEGWEYMKADLNGADLCGADLSFADLRGADLRRAYLCNSKLRQANLSVADLYGAHLYGADLCRANLREAHLNGVYLYGANLHEANLNGANLREAHLHEANLNGANLREADLRWADLSGANLYGTYLSEADIFRLGKVLDEPLTGYKKTKEDVIITAEIPAGAIVFCINGRKCRTNRAKITDMAGHEVLHSDYDKFFEYRLGQEIKIKDFDLMYNVECTSGFHFFRTRKEAEEY